MSRRDELIETYARDLREKCGVEPDMDLLKKVTIGCGPSIYQADASTVSGTDPSELATVRNSFLRRKLGLPEGPDLAAAIMQTIELYGRSNRNKYRAVIYYLLVVKFNRQSVYD